MVLSEQQFRGVADLPESVLAHFIDAQFGRTSETVLDAPQDAVHIMLVAFELKDGIYNVFQYFRTGNAAFLVDVADEYDRRARFLGEFQYRRRTFAYLYDTSRRRIDVFGRDGLDGVDDDQVGGRILYMGENLFQRGLAGNQQIPAVFGMRDTVGTQLELADAFLSRNIEHLLSGKPEYGLKHQSRLTDARLSADQRQRTLYQSSSQHTVEFVVAHIHALLFSRDNLIQPLRLGAYRLNAVGHVFGNRSFLSDHFFHKRVPLSARRAFPCPFGRFLSAVRAYIYCLFLCHSVSTSSYVPLYLNKVTD